MRPDPGYVPSSRFLSLARRAVFRTAIQSTEPGIAHQLFVERKDAKLVVTFRSTRRRRCFTSVMPRIVAQEFPLHAYVPARRRRRRFPELTRDGSPRPARPSYYHRARPLPSTRRPATTK